MRRAADAAEAAFRHEYGDREQALRAREDKFYADRYRATEEAAAPLRQQLRDAECIIACLVRQLGGTARVPAEATLLNETRLTSWMDKSTQELVLSVASDARAGKG